MQQADTNAKKRVPGSRERAMLRVLKDAAPQTLDKQKLGERLGYPRRSASANVHRLVQLLEDRGQVVNEAHGHRKFAFRLTKNGERRLEELEAAFGNAPDGSAPARGNGRQPAEPGQEVLPYEARQISAGNGETENGRGASTGELHEVAGSAPKFGKAVSVPAARAPERREASITPPALDDVRRDLLAAAREGAPREGSLRAVLEALRDEIVLLRQAGWNDDEIAEALAAHGIETNALALEIFVGTEGGKTAR